MPKKKEGTLRIGIVAKLKQGDILEALRNRGWTQKQGAEFVGLDQSKFGLLINLKWVPEEFSPKLSIKLCELTGKTPEELFPEFARQKNFLEAPKVVEVLRDVTPTMLAERNLLQLPPSPENIIEQRELKKAVMEALHTLSPRAEKVLRLHFYEDQTDEQIASETGYTPSEIRTIRNRAMRALRSPVRVDILRPFAGR